MTDSNENTLSTRYDPKVVEEKWYQIWEQNGLFKPEYSNRDNATPYCITIPPPNVTGSLHMGHALCYSVQDALGRWRRMKGDRVLVLPGTDHAGIATQKVVEQQLKKEGKTRHDLGREAFVKRVWEWKEESGGMILKQFKRLGFAFDWSRERFTMDPQYHDAVLKVFIDWFERGLIYRGKRIVNWDPGLMTSVSDIEVYDETRKGKLYHFRYPFAEGGGYVVIATTRPETMLADVAVAVHPDDERYKKLIGKKLLLPLVNREIPLIADEYPDPTFGSGAVKITPAHDPNDFEVGARMGLDFNNTDEVPVCIDERAKVIAPNTPYHGLDRYEARKRIVEDLEAQGLIEKIEDYEIPLKISDRSGQVIEPLLSEQWFCRMKELAQPAIEAVKGGKINFTPERYTDIYLNWMENIKDWCLSRQLWWGHRIPIYYAQDGTPIPAMSQEEAERKSGGAVTPDPDVLDTWFSSALWPFATLGWPDETEDLKTFYPTNVLITDKGIIYLWVARMIMDGLDQMKEIPFKHVYVHATVLTEDGKRMSKSLGTGIDPIEYIDRYGADAMRFSLLVQAGHNQEIRFGDKRIEEARNFCNKIWNASRFALMYIGGANETPEFKKEDLKLEDKWILSRLTECAETVEAAFQNYNMMEACKACYSFFWSEFCDWYIEIIKPRLSNEDTKSVPCSVMKFVLSNFYKLMHPIMPHITEELYQMLAGDNQKFLDFESWAEADNSMRDSQAEHEMDDIMELVREIRSLRQDFGYPPLQKIPVLYVDGFKGDTEMLKTLTWFERVEQGQPDEPFVSTSVSNTDVYLILDTLFNVDAQLQKYRKDIEKIDKELLPLESRMSNENFVSRAKPEVVQKEREAIENLKLQKQRVLEKISMLEKIH